MFPPRCPPKRGLVSTLSLIVPYLLTKSPYAQTHFCIGKTHLHPSRSPLTNGGNDLHNHFPLRLRSYIAFAMEADADGVGLHVARADDEHGVDFGFFGALDFAVDLVVGEIAFAADHVGAEFFHDIIG